MNRPGLDQGRESRARNLIEDDWREFVRPQEGVIINENSPREPFDQEKLIGRVRQSYIDRRKRIIYFGDWMFGEPAWDILLVLYIDSKLQRCTVGRLTELAGAALTTIIRWIEALEKRGFVRRTPHPNDRRSSFIELTSKGEEALNSYFSETLMEP